MRVYMFVCMYVCMYIYIYIYTHVYIYIYIYIHIHVYMYMWRSRTLSREPSSVCLLCTLLDLCVSSLSRGHANIIWIGPILTDDPRRESFICLFTVNGVFMLYVLRALRFHVLCVVNVPESLRDVDIKQDGFSVQR